LRLIESSQSPKFLADAHIMTIYEHFSSCIEKTTVLADCSVVSVISRCIVLVSKRFGLVASSREQAWYSDGTIPLKVQRAVSRLPAWVCRLERGGLSPGNLSGCVSAGPGAKTDWRARQFEVHDEEF
jgi:hypothetical protein